MKVHNNDSHEGCQLCRDVSIPLLALKTFARGLVLDLQCQSTCACMSLGRSCNFRGAPSAENDLAEDPTDVDGEGVIAGKVIGVKELLL